MFAYYEGGLDELPWLKDTFYNAYTDFSFGYGFFSRPKGSVQSDGTAAQSEGSSISFQVRNARVVAVRGKLEKRKASIFIYTRNRVLGNLRSRNTHATNKNIYIIVR